MSKESNGYKAVSQNGLNNHDSVGSVSDDGEALVKLKPRLGLVQGSDFLRLFP